MSKYHIEMFRERYGDINVVPFLICSGIAVYGTYGRVAHTEKGRIMHFTTYSTLEFFLRT